MIAVAQKVFDFNHPDFKKHSEAMQEFLLTMHDKPITEEQFIVLMQVIRSKSKKPKKSQRYSPSNCRYMYNRLKNNFGFFN